MTTSISNFDHAPSQSTLNSSSEDSDRNPHLPAPTHIKASHKALQHLLSSAPPIHTLHPPPPSFLLHDTIPVSTLTCTFNAFSPSTLLPDLTPVPVYYPSSHPGLYIIPGLLPVPIQRALLESLLTTHLANPEHLTNLHTHYHVPPGPFNLLHPETWGGRTHLEPLDPAVHKPLSLQRAREKKLRWCTLGGQYDWTKKKYPGEGTRGGGVQFPEDVKGLVEGLWPDICAEAAIVNVYSPGDQLAPHRDVAEESRKGLVSVSIGCEGVFMIARSRSATEGSRSEIRPPDGEQEGERQQEEVLAIRIRSGDVVVMSHEMRTAWHSVPRIEKGTCPEELEGWPVDGWLKGKRVNFNVRQMWD